MIHALPFIVFAIYVLVHDPAGDRVAAYEGMSQATVTALLEERGVPYEFISAQTYAARLLASRPVPLTPQQLLALTRSDAVGLLTGGKDSVSTLERAILLTILDQINTIRAALPTPLPAITPAQAKTAVQNKINAGTAD